MSTHMQRVLNPRNRSTSLDIERDKWQNSQLTGITKAINSHESPVKEKHIRTLIIGTFQTKSAQLFWNVSRNLQLQENPIVCWKFCHVLHKLLREGHRKTIPDSYPFRSMIRDLGKMWGLLREGYGKLIQNYCTLLIRKIDFHANNQRFPGNLMVSDQELEAIGENDVNIWFQLCCELFDYLDEILSLQANVFGSLDMSRSNSMTNAGQCRLAPLIPCIQDSSQLYDYSVKVLFKLHAVLPPGTLDGHRHRFLNQFKLLKSFYLNSKNLQYFKNLIQVPNLPNEPPNFLIQSDLDSHVTPVCILPQQPESPEVDQIDMNLVDLSFSEANEKSDDSNSIWSLSNDNRNENFSANVIEEKDRVIQRLMSRIEEIEAEMQKTKIQDVRLIEQLKRTVDELECAKAMSLEKEIETLKELEKQKANNDLEAVNKVADKYLKMKDFYNKLRVEHIELIRKKAESDKQLAIIKTELSETEDLKNTLESQLREHVRKEVEFSSMSSNCNEMRDKIDEYIKLIKKYEDDIQRYKLQIIEREWQLLVIVINEMQLITQQTNEDIPSGSVTVNSSPEYFFNRLEVLSNNLDKLEKSSTSIPTNPLIESLITTVLGYFVELCFVVNCAKVTYLTIPNLDLGQELLNNCKELVDLSLKLSAGIKKKLYDSKAFQSVRDCLNKLIAMNVSIIPELSDKTKDLAKLLRDEMTDMDAAINDAVLRIEQMLEMAKKNDSGIKLEVNGQILDACTYLMNAIKQLIHDSKQLQTEIVSQGKGKESSDKEFYQRNHRWTEGLISAAKVVALDAKLLVDSADKVILGSGKFEELIAASQEIAGASAQLVVASRVKAKPDSQKLSKLSQSSKKVSEATGNVVAITKKCSKNIEDADDLDFSKLTLHQAKRLEMDSQVRVLELENALEKERVKLASLRKQHYHLAGASAGWQ